MIVIVIGTPAPLGSLETASTVLTAADRQKPAARNEPCQVLDDVSIAKHLSSASRVIDVHAIAKRVQHRCVGILRGRWHLDHACRAYGMKAWGLEQPPDYAAPSTTSASKTKLSRSKVSFCCCNVSADFDVTGRAKTSISLQPNPQAIALRVSRLDS